MKVIYTFYLTALTNKTSKIIKDSEQIPEGFLEEKISKTKQNSFKNGLVKLIFGSSRFGIVKFALTLTSSSSEGLKAVYAGQILYKKKTRKEE